MAPAALRPLAFSSHTCAVASAVSKATIASRCAFVIGAGAWACPWVAPFDWSARSKWIDAKHAPPSPAMLQWSVPRKVSRPSHMTVERNCRFVVGSGRRKSDSSAALAKPYGSSTATSSKSAVAGTPMPTRMRPLLSTMLYAARLASRVETSALGEFEPSLVLKIAPRPSGSSITPPFVRSKIACTCAGTIVHPALGTWQLTQRRPFAPRSWKNSLPSSMYPAVLKVEAKPLGLGKGRPLGSCRRCSGNVTSP